MGLTNEIKKTNILLSKEALDNLVLGSQHLPKGKNPNDLVEYTTSSGQKIIIHPGMVTFQPGYISAFTALFGQTYPIHAGTDKPYQMTDYLFLAKEDGSKGAPWTRDQKTFEFFLRVAMNSGTVRPPFMQGGKRFIVAPAIPRYLYDGNQKERSGIGE